MHYTVMYKQIVWVIIDIPSGIYFFRTNQFLLNQMPHIEDVEVLELQIEDAGHLLEAANLVYTDQMNEIENKLNNKNGVNNDTSGLYDSEIFEEYENIMRNKEIEDEEYDMSHIGDDGDILYDNVNEDNYDDYDY